MLVVIGLIFLISMFAFPISLNQISENKSKNATTNLTSLIFNTQQDAYARKDNQAHGLVFQSNDVIIYSGESLQTAVAQETIDLSNDVNVSSVNLTGGGNEINFAAGGFRPSTNGSVRVSDGITVYEIIINNEGVIYYHEI